MEEEKEPQLMLQPWSVKAQTIFAPFTIKHTMSKEKAS
jgi:hypothetical protein